MTTPSDAPGTSETPLWFGPEGRPLFGWLTSPTGGLARGGVVCAPPIGREARAARRAMRSLTTSLAAQGFVTLRFDYDGTGDSGGGFDDIGRDRLWVDSVAEATGYLRSLGLESVSAVGMRLGATLIGAAANSHQLNFSSVVLWDPCESGQSYLRELHALEAIRRADFRIVPGGTIETSEFVFSPQATEEIRRLSLSKSTVVPFAGRTLVMARSDRAASARLRTHLTGKTVNWQTTNQQSALLDADPSWAALPYQTMDRIVRWFCAPVPTFAPFEVMQSSKEAVVVPSEDSRAITERIVEFGSGRLFGIVTAPVGAVRGPLVVMFNVANEEHTGPSRLWVELARRWAGFGLRSVRFDLGGLGDSPRLPGQSDHPFFMDSWLDDIIIVTQELSPEDPANALFIGLCSGAYWAIEAALKLRVRGVCALNPPVYVDFLHSVRVLESSRQPVFRRIGERLKILVKHPWIAAVTWHLLRPFLPSDWTTDLLEKLDKDDIDVLLLYSVEELWPFRETPFFRTIDVRRLSETSRRRIEFVPGLDHGMHVADGRTRAVNLLDRYVLEYVGGPTRDPESGSNSNGL